MPKLIEYPRSSFSKSILLAEAVYSLGDDCSKEIAGEKIGLKMSGNFTALISSAQRYNLITSEGGKLKATDNYKEAMLAYSDEEKIKHLRICFLTPPIFNSLYQKLKGKILPKNILSKMLIKDFGVEKDSASAVAKYFIDGLKEVNLLDANDLILDDSEISNLDIIDDNPNLIPEEQKDYQESSSAPSKVNGHNFDEVQVIAIDKYIVQFIGPGMNARYEIQEEDDILIVEAILSKIKKRLLKDASN